MEDDRKDSYEGSWIVHALIVFLSSVQFSHSVVFDSATPWIAARPASLSITNSRRSHRLTSIESVMPSSHLILCHPLLLLPPNPPSIRVFSNKSTLGVRWPKYWSFSFSISPSNEHSGLIFRMDWLDFLPLLFLNEVYTSEVYQMHFLHSGCGFLTSTLLWNLNVCSCGLSTYFI